MALTTLNTAAFAPTPSAIVSSATYEPFGPLSSLTLGNGLTETRLFDARYFPDGIQVPGRLDRATVVQSDGLEHPVAAGRGEFGHGEHRVARVGETMPDGGARGVEREKGESGSRHHALAIRRSSIDHTVGVSSG